MLPRTQNNRFMIEEAESLLVERKINRHTSRNSQPPETQNNHHNRSNSELPRRKREAIIIAEKFKIEAQKLQDMKKLSYVYTELDNKTGSKFVGTGQPSSNYPDHPNQPPQRGESRHIYSEKLGASSQRHRNRYTRRNLRPPEIQKTMMIEETQNRTSSTGKPSYSKELTASTLS